MQLGYSPCPNDTFIFHALENGLLEGGFSVRAELADVQTLNRWAAEGRLPLTKVSVRAAFEYLGDYVALASGGAYGFGVGPLVVAKEDFSDLSEKTVASPGEHTTAELLLRMRWPDVRVLRVGFTETMAAVADGRADAGLVIHEARFALARHGMRTVADLGRWWQGETNLPLPLGVVLARRDLGEEALWRAEQAIAESVRHARRFPAEVAAQMLARAEVKDEAALWSHVDLYVGALSEDAGLLGRAAVHELQKRATAAGLLPCGGANFFR